MHIADTYGKAHHGRPGTVAAITEWADEHRIPLVDLKQAVAEEMLAGRGTRRNPWSFPAHQAVAELMLKASPRPGCRTRSPATERWRSSW